MYSNVSPATARIDGSPADAAYTLVDDVPACAIIVRELLRVGAPVAVDLEGENLSRTGPLCLLQVATRSHTYLFDVCVLGEAGFAPTGGGGWLHQGSGGGGLKEQRPLFCFTKELLENRSLQKAFYDVRNDVDALYTQFGVRVSGAVDVQILFAYTHQERSDGYLKGLGKALEEYGRLQRWTERQQQEMELVKTRGLRLFAHERGGRPSVWRTRPLLPELATYAACDVRHLLGMLDVWSGGPAKLAAVRQATELRIATALAAHRPLEGRERARRDFAFGIYGLPPGANRNRIHDDRRLVPRFSHSTARVYDPDDGDCDLFDVYDLYDFSDHDAHSDLPDNYDAYDYDDHDAHSWGSD